MQRAGDLVESGHIGVTMMKPGDDHIRLRENRGSAVVPIQSVATKTLDQIRFPANLPIQADRGEVAALEINKHCRAIGDGRRIAARAMRIFSRVLRTEGFLPERLS